jgi:chromosomal replication initiator protein
MTSVWVRILRALDREGVSHQERAFLSITRLAGVLDETALIAVPNDFSKDIVETRLRGRISGHLTAELDRPLRLAVTVDPSLAEAEPLDLDAHDPQDHSHATDPQRATQDDPAVVNGVADLAVVDLDDPEVRRAQRRLELDGLDADETPMPRAAEPTGIPADLRRGSNPENVELTRLNPKYTFETFVIGASNRFAHAQRPQSGRRPPRHTTHCSSMAAPDWARPTCCMPSATTPAASTPM